MTFLFFFTVKDSSSKVKALTRTVRSHFLKKEKIHLVVPDLATLQFVDQLLWSQPKESFLPHSCGVLLPFQDLIFISLSVTSLEPFPIVFNLCPEPYLPSASLKTLYELEDLTHPHKSAIFQKKFQTYQKAGFQIGSKSLEDFE
jgi:DNA polymerase-3 subunit chi